MNKALEKSRDAVGKHTPKMEKITVEKKDIATVIGKVVQRLERLLKNQALKLTSMMKVK